MDGCDNGFGGSMGGADFPMSTVYNTNGIGDPVPAPANGYGSGDVFYGLGGFGMATKKGTRYSNSKSSKKKNNNNSFQQFGNGSISSGNFDMSPKPLYVPFGGNSKK